MPEIKLTAHTIVVKSSDARHAKQRDSTASQLVRWLSRIAVARSVGVLHCQKWWSE
jgi:hypothetical protein